MFIRNQLIRTLNNQLCKNQINSFIQHRQTRLTSTLDQNDDFSIVANSSATIRTQDLPLLINRKLKYPEMFNEKITPPREAWIEDFTNNFPQKLAIIKLHPKIFAQFPDPDVVKQNLMWQNNIHWINFLSVKTKNELGGSTKKPWPQKGLGRARHGSKRSYQWKNGAWFSGPRGPMTKYSLLTYFKRINGLCATLTSKLAQNDLKIVNDLESFYSDDPKDLEAALEQRGWGPSCLIVDTVDMFPKNIALAAHTIDWVNLMPVYGLNVHSMLKHETLILTVNALNDLESKLLHAFNRTDLMNVMRRHEAPNIIPEETPEFEGCRWTSNLHNPEYF